MAAVSFYNDRGFRPDQERNVSLVMLQKHLFPHLDAKSILKFGRNEQTLTPLREKFIAQFGAIAACEAGVSTQLLWGRIQKLLALAEIPRPSDSHKANDYRERRERKQIPAPRSKGEFLTFDTDEVPVCTNYISFFTQPSVWQRFLAKYRFFRGEYHKPVYEVVRKKLDDQDKVISEFLNQDLDSSHPLQDLRDRSLRIETFQFERVSLNRLFQLTHQTYALFLENLSFFEKTSFKIISYFHSFRTAAFSIEKEPILPPLQTDLKSFTNQKFVKFGTTEITFNGTKIPVQISAKFEINSYYTNFSGQTLFSIHTDNIYDHDHQLGCIVFERSWSGEGHNYVETSTFGINCLLTERHLYVQYTEDFKGQDPLTGDMPVRRLLTQIAAEVLHREDENRLVMASNHHDCDVFFAGGFACTYQKGSFSNNFRAIRQARDNGQLYPEHRHLGGFPVQVCINKLPTLKASLGTAFTASDSDEEVKQPALVDFVLKAEPITWEAQIEQQPLLGKSEGPILPKFFYRNLFAYEASEKNSL